MCKAFAISIVFVVAVLSHAVGLGNLKPSDIGRRFDEYGYFPFKEEKKRLSNLAAQLRDEQQLGVKAYVYVFGGNGAHSSEAKARACYAKHYLISQHIDPTRVLSSAILNRPGPFKVELCIWPAAAPDDLGPSGDDVVRITNEEAKSCRPKIDSALRTRNRTNRWTRAAGATELRISDFELRI